MTHLDPELLALLALGEDAASPADRRHLASCAECGAELRGLARAVAASRGAAVPLTEPGPRVWAGIAAELGLDPALVDPSAATVVPPRRRRAPVRRRTRILVAAGLVVVLLAGAAIGLTALLQQPERLAAATLQALPGWQGRGGTAVVERLPDGRRVLELQTTVQPGATTDHEVWLMTDGAKRLVPLGLLHGTGGTFDVPANVDLTRFRVVDVSNEPRDGNPAHSGVSIVRGVLRS